MGFVFSALRRKRCLFPLVGILSLGAVVQAQQGGPGGAVPVTTAVAQSQQVPVTLSGIGTVRAAQSVAVKTRVDGTLDKVAFNEGQDVKAGELLAQIDPRPFQASLDQAVAQKAHDEVTLVQANRDLQRYATLATQNQIAQQTLDAQRATVDQTKASIQADQAQIDSARVQLEYTTIRAPITGRTGLRLVDAGNVVHTTDTTGLVVINQIDPIAVVFTLPEGQFQQVNRALQADHGSHLPVTASGRDDNEVLATGTLTLVDNQIDSSSGSFQLKALFKNPEHKLWPGQYVLAKVVVGTLSNAVTVPAAAVQRGSDGFLVYVVKSDNTVQARAVQVGRTEADRSVIQSGLAAGERVITDGGFKVKAGTRVIEAGSQAGR